MTTVKNVPAIMQKIVDGTAPAKFTYEHLDGLGFKSSADRAIIPVLKDLGFLSADGAPTQRYHDYRDKSQSKRVMADAMRDAYSEIFHINATPSEADRSAVQGKFKSVHNVSDDVAEKQTTTFFALLKLADLTGTTPVKKKLDKADEEDVSKTFELAKGQALSLRYNIEVHLPATKDIDVYNAIFKSLKTHLLA
jgi:hypothetical protein